MIMLYYAYKVIYLYQGIFDNNVHISDILFKFFSHKLLASISNNKIYRSKIYVNPAQVEQIPDMLSWDIF